MEPVPRGFEKHEGILFYINPFNKGFVFNKRDVDYFLRQLKIEPRKEFYMPCSTINIVRRVLRNLIPSSQQLGATQKTEELTTMLDVSIGRPPGRERVCQYGSTSAAAGT